MKVGTDGVLLGAWVNVKNASKILDIGTGTGLIALMLAQRSNAFIEAIDIELGAVKDAAFNFNQSKWANRLAVYHASLQNFILDNTNKYNCIVCNPPFFSNALKSVKKERTTARHTSELSFDALLKGVSILLEEGGSFNVILPVETEQPFRSIANNYRLFAKKIARVKPKPSKSIKRVLIEFGFESIQESENELILETETHHEYSNDAISLFKDFYLKL